MCGERIPLKNGSLLFHNGTRFEIKSVIGSGGNAFAYKAEYKDSLIEGGVHQCVIKELFPLRRDGGIRRAAGGELECDEEALAFFGMNKRSFLRGNAVHLDILGKNPDSVGINVDSFEANNTVYTVLGLNSVTTLKQKRDSINSLSEAIGIIIKLLNAVEVFHKANLLHLDISPENIILSPSNGEERVLLIDFNSCAAADGELTEYGVYTGINPNYSAPELKLGRFKEISEASDIFSVSAVLVYLISGEDFMYALTNFKRLSETVLLKDAPANAVRGLRAVLARGLRSRPSLRYHNAEEMLEECMGLKALLDKSEVSLLRRLKRHRKAAICATAAVLAVSLSCAQAVYYFFPATHPIGGREKRNNYEIMSAVVRAVNNINYMTLNEELLTERMGPYGDGDTENALAEIGARLDLLNDAEVRVENFKEKTFRGLDTGTVIKILDMSAQHRQFQKSMFSRWGYAVSSGIYTRADIESEINYYREYLMCYERMTAYELCLLTRSVNRRGSDVIRKAMTGGGSLVDSFNNAMEMNIGDLKSSIASLEQRLKMLEAKLGLIQEGGK